MRKTITVTKDHIKSGVRTDGDCPLTLALKEALKDDSITCSYVKVYTAKGSYFMNSKLKKFVLDFDRGLPVSEFSFEFELRE